MAKAKAEAKARARASAKPEAKTSFDGGGPQKVTAKVARAEKSNSERKPVLSYVGGPALATDPSPYPG